jgi:hypothetical protein
MFAVRIYFGVPSFLTVPDILTRKFCIGIPKRLRDQHIRVPAANSSRTDHILRIARSMDRASHCRSGILRSQQEIPTYADELEGPAGIALSCIARCGLRNRFNPAS